MAYEDPAFTRKRIKLFRSGLFNQDEITQLFKTLDSPEDLHNMKKIVDKSVEILNESLGGDKRTFLLTAGLVQIFTANDVNGVNEINIRAVKRKGKWWFEIGAS